MAQAGLIAGLWGLPMLAVSRRQARGGVPEVRHISPRCLAHSRRSLEQDARGDEARMKRSGSEVQLRTLDNEKPGSNPVQVCSLYIAPVHSAV